MRNVIVLVLLLITATSCGKSEKPETAGEYIDSSTTTSLVKTALAKDDMIDSFDIKVVTYKGVVQLSGFVDSIEQKNRAFELAKEIKGVTEVINHLELKDSQEPISISE